LIFGLAIIIIYLGCSLKGGDKGELTGYESLFDNIIRDLEIWYFAVDFELKSKSLEDLAMLLNAQEPGFIKEFNKTNVYN
jgi:hypothetical protein